MPEAKEREESAFVRETRWRADVRSFAGAILQYWNWWVGATVASGAASWIQGIGGMIDKWVFWAVGAALGLVVSAFRAWLDERRKVKALEARLSTEIGVEYGTNISGCIARGSFRGPVVVIFHRVKVTASGVGPLTNCAGYLTQIEKDGVEKWGGDTVLLTFAPAEQADCVSKTIADGLHAFLDVVYVTERNEVGIATDKRQWRFNPTQQTIFKEHGEYLFKIAISSSNSKTAHAVLRFSWKGDWRKTDASLIQCDKRLEKEPQSASSD